MQSSILKTSQYAYMQTMVSIFAQQLFLPEQLRLIANKPLEQIFQYEQFQRLYETYQCFIDDDIKCLPAGNIDKHLHDILFDEAIVIIRPLKSHEQAFFSYWMRRFELQNVKTIIRGKSLHHHHDKIRQELISLSHFSYLSIDKLIHGEDIIELLKYLEDTPYASISRYARQHYQQKNDVFTAESSINHQFYEGLSKRLQVFSNQDKKTIHQLLGLIIDQINLITLLRYRLYYHFSAPQTYFHQLSGGRYLHQQQLLALSQIEDLEQINELLPDKYQKLLSQINSLHDIELAMESYIINEALQLLKRTRYTVSQAFIYLIIREKQLSQLHTIIKGKMLGLTPTAINFALGSSAHADTSSDGISSVGTFSGGTSLGGTAQ